MGSVVVYRCVSCSFGTERLQVGWGKAGRARFWGGLAVCTECKDLLVVNLAEPRAERRDRRCPRCNTALKLLEGTADTIPCPACGKKLRHATVGSWD
jgi:DNA-directed RNA polymerase subunit RPC12/RpoP